MFKYIKHRLRLKRSSSCTVKTVEFSTNLLSKLKNEHDELIAVFNQIESIKIDHGLNPALDQHLGAFRSRFQTHLIVENVELYEYLDHSIDNTSSSNAMVSAFKQDLNDIAYMVNSFCRTYETRNFDTQKINEFKSDYFDMSIALQHRFNIEERDLFTLYQST